MDMPGPPALQWTSPQTVCPSPVPSSGHLWTRPWDMWTHWLGSVAPRPPIDTANVCQSSQPHSVRANPIHPWQPGTFWVSVSDISISPALLVGVLKSTEPCNLKLHVGNPLDPRETISAHWRLAGEFPYTCLAVIFHVARKSLHLQESGRPIYRCCWCLSLHVVGHTGRLIIYVYS